MLLKKGFFTAFIALALICTVSNVQAEDATAKNEEKLVAEVENQCPQTAQIEQLEVDLSKAMTEKNAALQTTITQQIVSLRKEEYACLSAADKAEDLGDIAPAAGGNNNNSRDIFSTTVPEVNSNQISPN